MAKSLNGTKTTAAAANAAFDDFAEKITAKRRKAPTRRVRRVEYYVNRRDELEAASAKVKQKIAPEPEPSWVEKLNWIQSTVCSSVHCLRQRNPDVAAVIRMLKNIEPYTDDLAWNYSDWLPED